MWLSSSAHSRDALVQTDEDEEDRGGLSAARGVAAYR